MNRAHNLYRLQKIDLRLDKNQGRIEEINSWLEDTSGINELERKLESAEEDFREKHISLQSADHAVASQRSKIERNEKTLYSGSVRNPKELQDLQMELQSLKRYLATLEDRLLEAMVAHEEAEKLRAAKLESLEQLKETRRAKGEGLQEEKSQLQHEIARLEGEREAALASVPDEDLVTYEKLRLKGAGVAVSTVSDGSCGICGLSISGSRLQSVRSGTKIVQCSHCSRILYYG